MLVYTTEVTKYLFTVVLAFILWYSVNFEATLNIANLYNVFLFLANKVFNPEY